MSQTRDPRIDAYIAAAAPFAQPILTRLRAWVHEGCPAVVETIKWNMPHFLYAGKILCGMAAFRAHCAFGFRHPGMAAVLGGHAAPAGTAMGDFGRITALTGLPAGRTMVRFVRAAARLNESGPAARPARAGRLRSGRRGRG
jgi:hypothetical protein